MTRGFFSSSMVRCRRFFASVSPSTASPRRLRLSWKPSSLDLSSRLFNALPSASSTRCPTICLSRLRASGITTLGSFRAMSAPAETRPRSTSPTKSGMLLAPKGLARLRNSRAATSLSSGRATRSTNPMVNSTPCGSRTSAASCSVDFASERDCPLVVAASHCCARWTAASTMLSTSELLGSGVRASDTGVLTFIVLWRGGVVG